jgi:hypothetical protein
VQLLPYLDSPQKSIQSFIDESSSEKPLPLLVRPFVCSMIIGTLTIVGQLLLLLAGIRRNLLQVYRGDDSSFCRMLAMFSVDHFVGAQWSWWNHLHVPLGLFTIGPQIRDMGFRLQFLLRFYSHGMHSSTSGYSGLCCTSP